MAKKQKRSSGTGSSWDLGRCLRELRWLERSQEDDAVSVDEWRRRGNRLLERAGALGGRDRERFDAAWDAFQAAEAGALPLPVAGPSPLDRSQAEVDAEAYRRISELLAGARPAAPPERPPVPPA